jgi:hypothetical protein
MFGMTGMEMLVSMDIWCKLTAVLSIEGESKALAAGRAIGRRHRWCHSKVGMGPVLSACVIGRSRGLV